MHEPSQSTASPNGRHRWSAEETFLFLELLLEARRCQHLNSNRIRDIRDVLESFIPTLSTRFPNRQWNMKVIENRFAWLKGTWQAFCAAAAIPGTTFNEETGMLQINKASAKVLESGHKRYGSFVVAKPLPTNDNVTRSEWAEIFLTDLPARDTTFDSHHYRGFSKPAEAEATEEGEGQPSQEGQEEAWGGTQDNNAGDESPEEDTSDEDILDLQPSRRNANNTRIPTVKPSNIARPAASSSRNTYTTPKPLHGLPNRFARSLPQNRIMEQSSELSQVLSNVRGPRHGGRQEHIIIHQARSPHAEEIEKASKDCQLLFEDFGIPTMMKVILWLKEDTMNAPIWNSLSSKEAKIVLVETILGAELSR
ncbi:hypothetical protein E4U13_004497 [Claviceps humidiphila]|uniref:Myb/SANT-like domain-containing protein n=1 Tax=Claviceps humidiphila TaxID=1294629 RepID=A0A9P7TVR5_9HYPO|nr:hypothetical protein E4U13_004497 [Claviceps humidiphila]